MEFAASNDTYTIIYKIFYFESVSIDIDIFESGDIKRIISEQKYL